MRLALVQAALVVKKVFPYPGVGVVIVNEGHIIAKAHNGKPGSGVPHAEVQAISEAEKGHWPLTQCVLYTNLEPCVNEGLVGACTEAIITAGIPEVHVAMQDNYREVRGKGIARLMEAGVKVIRGECEEEARWMLRKYTARFCPSCGHPIED